MNHVGKNVEIHKMDTFNTKLIELHGHSVLLDPSSNTWISNILEDCKCTLIISPDPCTLPKACKNDVEMLLK